MDALEPRHRAFLQEFQQMLEAGRLAHAVTSGGRSLEASRSRSPVRDRRPPEPSLTARLRFLECELASLAHRLQCLQLGASGLMLTLHQEPSHSAPFSALTDWVGVCAAGSCGCAFSASGAQAARGCPGPSPATARRGCCFHSRASRLGLCSAFGFFGFSSRAS